MICVLLVARMMRHFAQCVIAWLKTCNLSLVSPVFLCEEYVAMSYVNWLRCVPDFRSGMSDTQIFKSVGDRTAPYGVSALSVRC